MYSGGVGSGKTVAEAIAVLADAARHPGILILLGRKHRTDLMKTTYQEFMAYCPPDWIQSWNGELRILTFRNGSQIMFCSLDNPLRLRSITAGRIYIEEGVEVREESHRELTRRLRQPGYPLGFRIVTNPGGREHYLYRFYVDPAVDRSERGVHYGSTDENVFTGDDYHHQVDILHQGDEHSRFYHGQWLDLGKRIFSNCDEKNFIRPIELQPHWSYYRAIDWGFDHDFVCLWAAIDESDPRYPRMILYREYIQNKRLIRQHAAEIYRHTQNDYAQGLGRVRETFTDVDLQEMFEMQNVPEVDHRILCTPATKNSRVQSQRAVNGGFARHVDGWPSIFITHECPILYQQCVNYRRPDDAKDEGECVEYEARDGKYVSVVDAVDALRYLWHTYRSRRFNRVVGYDPGMTDAQRWSRSYSRS